MDVAKGRADFVVAALLGLGIPPLDKKPVVFAPKIMRWGPTRGGLIDKWSTDMTAVGGIRVDVDKCRHFGWAGTPYGVNAGKEVAGGKHHVAGRHADGVAQKTGAAVVAHGQLDKCWSPFTKLA